MQIDEFVGCFKSPDNCLAYLNKLSKKFPDSQNDIQALRESVIGFVSLSSRYVAPSPSSPSSPSDSPLPSSTPPNLQAESQSQSININKRSQSAPPNLSQASATPPKNVFEWASAGYGFTSHKGKRVAGKIIENKDTVGQIRKEHITFNGKSIPLRYAVTTGNGNCFCNAISFLKNKDEALAGKLRQDYANKTLELAVGNAAKEESLRKSLTSTYIRECDKKDPSERSKMKKSEEMSLRELMDETYGKDKVYIEADIFGPAMAAIHNEPLLVIDNTFGANRLSFEAYLPNGASATFTENSGSIAGDWSAILSADAMRDVQIPDGSGARAVNELLAYFKGEGYPTILHTNNHFSAAQLA
jgi:hypothetical protein